MPEIHVSRSSVTFGPFAFDRTSRLLKRDGVELPLPPRVAGVLEVLLNRAGDVVPRQELIDRVWTDAFVTDTSLAEAVSALRQTLGDDPQAPSYIQTLHRRGYRFVAPIAEAATVNVSGAPATEKLSVPVSVEPSIGLKLLPWSIALITTILASVAVWEAVTRRKTAPLPVTRFAITPVAGTRFDARAPALAVSADASQNVWAACEGSMCRLYVRPSDRLEAVAIPGTEDAAAPFFSPDGRAVGFFANGHLKRVALTGGAPVTLADAADPLGGVWTPSGRIIYAGAGPGLKMIRETGGEPLTLTTPREADGEVRHAWPALHPSTDLMFFSIATVPEADVGGRLASMRLDARNHVWTTLIAGVGRASAVSDDALLLSRGAEVQAVAFDARRVAVSGAPQTVLSNLAVSRGSGQFAVSSAGAVLSIGSSAGDVRPSFFWNGETRGAAAARDLDAVRLAPDGRRVIGVDASDALRPDIWIADLERATSVRLTHDGVNAVPIWSADGARVFYASSTGGTFAIYSRDVDSERPAVPVHQGAAHAIPSSVSPDGSILAFIARDGATGADVWGLPLNGGTIQPLIRTPFDDVAAVFSPDGRLIAYQSNDAGRWEIYVHRRSDQRRVTVSSDGGTRPFWSADGRSLFFQSRERLMRTAISADGSSIGQAEIVMPLTHALPIGARADGRVLFQRRTRMPGDAAVLALQWAREVRQILGPPSAAMPR